MKKVILILCLAISFISFAQNAPKTQVVEVDPDTGLISEEFPFDRNFYIKLKIKKDVQIKSVSLARTYGPKFKIKDDEETIYDNLIFREEEIKDEKEFKSLLVLAPPLSPNRQYELVLSKKYSGDELDNLMKLFYLLDEGVGIGLDKIIEKEKEFKVKEEQLKEFIKNEKDRLEFKKQIDSTIFDFSAIAFDNKSRYVDLYESIAKSEPEKCITTAPNPITKYICENDTLTLNLVKQYLKLLENHCKKDLKCEGVFPYSLGTYKGVFLKVKPLFESLALIKNSDITSLTDSDLLTKAAIALTNAKEGVKGKDLYKTSLSILANLKSFDSRKSVKIVNGQGTISGELSQKITHQGNLASVKINVDKNISSFKTLVEDLKTVRLIYSSYEEIIESLISEANIVLGTLKKYSKDIEKIIKRAQKFDSHVLDEYVFANTQFQKLSTEANKWILPDVGLLYAFNKNSDVLRPFLGVNINFGPVDKDIKTRYISGDQNFNGANRFGRFLRQHTSLMLGISYGSLKIENERDDLFNSINVITGVGLRINRALRISGGTLWYNQVNPNPLISDKKTKAMGYFSLSFDIEFKKASGGNVSKLF